MSFTGYTFVFLSIVIYRSISNGKSVHLDSSSSDQLSGTIDDTQNVQNRMIDAQLIPGEITRILSLNENDYYGVLGVNAQATEEDIDRAFRKLAPRVHSDKVSAGGSKEAMQRLNKARAELKKRFEKFNSSTHKSLLFLNHPIC